MKYIAVSIFSIFISLPVKAEDRKLLFNGKLHEALVFAVPVVAMQEADSEDVISFIMIEMKRKFGAAQETKQLSDDENEILKGIHVTYPCPQPSQKATCVGERMTMREIIDNVCSQLHFKLVIDLEGGFNFVPEGIELDVNKYECSGRVYVKKKAA